MSQENQANYYAIIIAPVLHSKKLSNDIKILYGHLSALSNVNGYAWPSNQYLADQLNVKIRAIQNWLKILEKEGFIKIIHGEEDGTPFRHIYLSDEFKNISTHASRNTPPHVSKNTPPHARRNTHNNTSVNTTRNNNTSSKVSKKKEPDKPVRKKEEEENKFKITFNRKTKEFNGLTNEIIDILKQTFPHIDVSKELTNMKSWLMLNIHRAGNKAFIRNWLSKATPSKPMKEEELPPPEIDEDLKKMIRERDERNKKLKENYERSGV